MKKIKKTLGAMVLASLALGSCGEETPLNTSPAIGNASVGSGAYVLDGEVVLRYLDSENKRMVFFHDYGFNGTLDKVTINRAGHVEYSAHDKAELEKWQESYLKARRTISERYIPTSPKN